MILIPDSAVNGYIRATLAPSLAQPTALMRLTALLISMRCVHGHWCDRGVDELILVLMYLQDIYFFNDGNFIIQSKIAEHLSLIP